MFQTTWEFSYFFWSVIFLWENWLIVYCSVTWLCPTLCDSLCHKDKKMSLTFSQTSLKLMSIKSVMPSNHLVLVIPFSSCLQSFSASESFPKCWLFESAGQSIGASASASASVLPMNIQDWCPLGLTSLICLQSKGLSRVFSSTTVRKHQ